MMMMVTMVGDDRVCNFNNIDVVSRHGDAERTGTGGGEGASRAGAGGGVRRKPSWVVFAASSWDTILSHKARSDYALSDSSW